MNIYQTENKNNYESKTYEELSKEFQSLYPTAVKAFQLIRMMYNRLTHIDRLNHKEAFRKICEDHKYLSGFSPRNLRRYLPQDNPNVPHRIRTSRPNSSGSEIGGDTDAEFSNIKSQNKIEAKEVIETHNDNNNQTDENDGNSRIKKLEEELKQLTHELENKRAENAGLLVNIENLERKVDMLPKRNGDDVNSSPADENIINFEVAFKWIPVFEYMNKLFKAGLTSKVWFSGTIDRQSGTVISVYTGRRQELAENDSKLANEALLG